MPNRITALREELAALGADLALALGRPVAPPPRGAQARELAAARASTLAACQAVSRMEREQGARRAYGLVDQAEPQEGAATD